MHTASLVRVQSAGYRSRSYRVQKVCGPATCSFQIIIPRVPLINIICACFRENPVEAVKFIGSSLLSDKALVVGGHLYNVHSGALSLHSGFFKAALAPSFAGREGQSTSFEVHLPEPAFFRPMLPFLYTGQCPQHTDSEIPPLLLNAAFLDCPAYTTGLVRTALQRNWRVLLDERLQLSVLGDGSALQELQRSPDNMVALRVLAHWSRLNSNSNSYANSKE